MSGGFRAAAIEAHDSLLCLYLEDGPILLNFDDVVEVSWYI